MHRLDQLTPGQQRILDLIADGLSNAEIAAELYYTEKTVKNYVTQILTSIGARNRTEAAVAWVTRTPAESPNLADLIADEVTKQLAEVLTYRPAA